MRQVLHRLVAHHEALRLRFQNNGAKWSASVAPAEENDFFVHVDLSHTGELEPRDAMMQSAREQQASLDLYRGPLLRAVRYDFAPGRPSRLLLVVHHLAIDGVSWRILLEDLDHLLTAPATGAPVSLPLQTTSIRRWSRRLEEYASSQELQQERGFWIERLQAPVPKLPLDHPGGIHQNTVASERTFSLALGADQTSAILRQVAGACSAGIDAVLLAALAWAITEWTGARSLLVQVEGHGREDLFEDIDLSRTVGWFTALYPVLLDLDGASTVAIAVDAVQKQLRAIPRHGIGYGLLRYLSADGGEMHRHARPEITFNYLGQFDSIFSPARAFQMVEEPIGQMRGLRDLRHHLLAVDVAVVHGLMHVTWSYSENLHQSETIETLAHSFEDALGSLISWSALGGSPRRVPADFPESGLNQAALDELLTELGES